MSEPFLGEIRVVGFNFAPKGWAFCDGQILPINQNQSLYSLLGTTYGGDGRTTFALPDLRGRAPLHMGRGPGLSERKQGSKMGTETVTLNTGTMPSHRHNLTGSNNDASVNNPQNAIPAKAAISVYSSSRTQSRVLFNDIVSHTGGGQAHTNMMPYLTLNYCIALRGLFPSRN